MEGCEAAEDGWLIAEDGRFDRIMEDRFIFFEIL